ncbi:porin family protein [Aliarcobacter faecis]|uniref:porin family protein n=1 Tax=Aliarcobacter faecis TaxID=1564138 RepID=UPI001CDD50B0|nr:porin family protein [Aliarcobacter faecis]QKF72900.1 porin family protein [Aliarcobacter faecis]
MMKQNKILLIAKKSLLTTIFVGLFSSAFAMDTKFYAGVSAAKVDGHNYTQYNIGQNSSTKFDNDIIFAFSNTLSYGRVKTGLSATTLDLDLKLGYEFIENLRAYAIGTGAIQYYDNSTYTGLGYGGALEYRISSLVSLEGSYKTMNMSKSNHSYDYDTASLGVRFGF